MSNALTYMYQLLLQLAVRCDAVYAEGGVGALVALVYMGMCSITLVYNIYKLPSDIRKLDYAGREDVGTLCICAFIRVVLYTVGWFIAIPLQLLAWGMPKIANFAMRNDQN